MSTQVFRFIVVGLVCTLINYGVFYLLFALLGVNYLLSSASGFIAGVVFGYPINRLWTFEVSKAENSSLLKYFIVYLISLAISLLLMAVFVQNFGIGAQIANVICILVTTCTNFLGIKFTVFNSKQMSMHGD